MAKIPVYQIEVILATNEDWQDWGLLFIYLGHEGDEHEVEDMLAESALVYVAHAERLWLKHEGSSFTTRVISSMTWSITIATTSLLSNRIAEYDALFS